MTRMGCLLSAIATPLQSPSATITITTSTGAGCDAEIGEWEMVSRVLGAGECLVLVVDSKCKCNCWCVCVCLVVARSAVDHVRWRMKG